MGSWDKIQLIIESAQIRKSVMADSRHSVQPEADSDLLGYLRWEYDRLRFMTMLRSAQFAYGHSGNSSEVSKGASSSNFSFAVIYGENGASNRSMRIDGNRAISQCANQFLKPLWRLQKSFNEGRDLPRRCNFREEDTCDRVTLRRNVLIAQYVTDVLIGWFMRARQILTIQLNSQSDAILISPVKFVPDSSLLQAAWDWAQEAVNAGDSSTRNNVVFLKECVDEIPRPDDVHDDPGQWVVTGDVEDMQSQEDSLPSLCEVEWSEDDEEDSDEEGILQAQLRATVDIEEQQQRAQDDMEEASDRACPEIPFFEPTGVQDVTSIAGIDFTSLYFTDIKVIESVPVCYRDAWAKANTTVYKWVEDAVPGTMQYHCALFWELLLHRLLLRSSPRSRGRGRNSKDTLSNRFKAFQEGDYQFLVKGLQRACDRAAKLPPKSVENDESRTLGRVQKLLAKGRFSKAYRLLDSKGQASMQDPGVVAQLDAKHGKRDYELPGSLPDNLPDIVQLKESDLKRVYSELKPLAGTGPCGYRNEYLRALSGSMCSPQAADAINKHASFASSYVNAELPKWYYYVACATSMMALIKKAAMTSGGTPDVRPIGMGGCKRRAWTSLLMQDNADVFRKTFWPVQVAVGVKAGVAKLFFATTEHMRAHPDHTLLKLDFTNAFNSVWRMSILKECYDNPDWRHLYRFFWINLSPKSRILAIHSLSEEGVQQGDPSGPLGFCIALHRHAVWAHEQLQQVGGMAIFDMDDGYFMGPIDRLMEIVAEFQIRLKKYVGAILNASKCQLWCRDHKVIQTYLANHPDGQFCMGSIMLPDGSTAHGVQVSGVPFGDEAYVQSRMQMKVDTVVSQITNTTRRLQHVSRQNLYALLTQCLNTKIQFWLQCMEPQVLRSHLHKLDKAILESARVATGAALEKDTLSLKRIRWPRRLWGGALRSAADVHAAAYLGGICLCVPSFTASVDRWGDTSPGVLDHMSDVYGEGSFDVGKEESRFQSLLDSGTRLGEELRAIFHQLSREVHGVTHEDELPGDSPFALGPAGVGVIEGRVLSRPQHELTETREDARAHSVTRRLKRKFRQGNVAPTQFEAAYLSANKLSSQFVGVPAMRHTVLDDSIFQEVWARYLGEPSPACAHWVGTEFKPCLGNRKKIDAYGHNVMRSHVHGDGWRTRHDAFKWALAEQASWCQYGIQVEPTNLFLPHITQREGFMGQRARKRQGLVPDFLDVKRNVLMDVKTFSWGDFYRPIRFRKARRCRGSRLRQTQVHSEYHKSAARIDRQYNGWDSRRGPGPVENALMRFGTVEGLAVGAFGEGSPHVLDLISKIAERGAARRFRELGYSKASHAFSVIKQHVYMVLGVEAMRGVGRLLLTNLGSILAGPASGRAVSSARASGKFKYSSQVDMYWSSHCHFDI